MVNSRGTQLNNYLPSNEIKKIIVLSYLMLNHYLLMFHKNLPSMLYFEKFMMRMKYKLTSRTPSTRTFSLHASCR